MNTTSQHFPRETAGLPAARPTEILDLADGERVELRIAPVTKRIGDATVRMLAYNGSIPGRPLAPSANVQAGSPDPYYWAPAHRKLARTLDDVLIEDGQIAPFSPDETNYAAMGRFGNVLLVAGETVLELAVRRGEVVRLFLT